MSAHEDGGGRDAAVNYKTRKRPAVYTITGDRCPPSVVPFRDNDQQQHRQQRQQQRRRPRTWTCGGTDGGGGSSLTRSRTFTSNYERAISSLLWQPYECRSSSNSLEDDGDVAVWLDSGGRYEPLSSRSSLSLSSTVPRSCASSVCRLLDDGGDKTPEPPPCWCAAADDDPNNETTTTGYRCPPRGSLLQRRGATAGRSRTAAAAVQSNANRPWSRVPVPYPRRVRDWCCDNGEDSYCCVYGDDVRVDDRRRPVPMNDVNGPADAKAAAAVAVQRHACAAERTYASTEAQTDETACPSAFREQRRRERRERRQQQRRVHPPQPSQSVAADALPDLLLNSHLPPPQPPQPPPPVYATVGACDVAVAARAANLQASLLPVAFQRPHQPPPGIATPVGANPPAGFRLPFGIIPARRRRSLHYCSEEDTPKSCCGLLTLPDATSTVSIRWFIGVVFVAGICSALVGTVLGATRASGREHLTVALLMIGVGVILVAISGIAWRLTAGQEASSCGAVFGLGRSLDDAAEANRRFVPRLPPSYGRPHHPYAAMMYPEFEYRAPPPSYQASMQEYRLRLLLLDRQTNVPPVTASPPPTYRSQPGTLIRGQNVCCRGDAGELYLYHQPSALLDHQQHHQQQHHQQHHQQQTAAADYSGPPSYRSRTGTLRPGCQLMMDVAAMMQMGSAAIVGVHDHHGRDPSQPSAAGAVGGCATACADGCDKVPPPTEDGGVVADGGVADGGVAIVVADEKAAERRRIGCGHAATATPPGAVVVTVSAAAADEDRADVRRRENEMEILAHL